MALNTKKWIHMVGVSGTGMSGLAKILFEQGYKISGSDLKINNVTEDLRTKGIEIFQGHDSSNIKEGVELLAISSAIPKDNPELVYAIKKGIPIIRRGELLASIVNQYKGIAVAGAHGKTTTTAMLYKILSDCRVDPSFIVGGQLQGNNLNAALGQGEYFVTEADESDASFLALNPFIAIVTNIENDHLDYYKSIENLHQAFKTFLEQVSENGFALLYGEDKVLNKLLEQYNKRAIVYGENEQFDYYMRKWQVSGMGSECEVFGHGKFIGKIRLNIPGKHNALNALASLAAAMELGLDFEEIKASLAGFRGTNRRFQILGQAKGITIVDDYAHHPTEIRATIKAAREVHKGRIVALFQPHRYSRTQRLYDEFGRSFADADVVFITDVYSAGESKIEGVSGELIYKAALNEGCQAKYVAVRDEIEDMVLKNLQKGDLLITLGAGDISSIGARIFKRMAEDH